jgi:hypothetical protein
MATAIDRAAYVAWLPPCVSCSAEPAPSAARSVCAHGLYHARQAASFFMYHHQPCCAFSCLCSFVCPAALNLPQWLNLSTARSMLLEKLMGHVAVSSLDAEEADKLRRQVLLGVDTVSLGICRLAPVGVEMIARADTPPKRGQRRQGAICGKCANLVLVHCVCIEQLRNHWSVAKVGMLLES